MGRRDLVFPWYELLTENTSKVWSTGGYFLKFRLLASMTPKVHIVIVQKLFSLF